MMFKYLCEYLFFLFTEIETYYRCFKVTNTDFPKIRYNQNKDNGLYVLLTFVKNTYTFQWLIKIGLRRQTNGLWWNVNTT